MSMKLDQELEDASKQKMFVCYEAIIERIIEKWANGCTNTERYIRHKALTQEEFGEKIGVRFTKRLSF